MGITYDGQSGRQNHKWSNKTILQRMSLEAVKLLAKRLVN